MRDLGYKYLSYFLFPGIALVMSWALTALAVWVMPRLGWVDVPRGRHAHDRPTPTGGGVAIAFAFLAAWGLLLISPWAYFIGVMKGGRALPVAIFAGVFVVVGLMDDRFNVRARYKLMVQIVVAAACWHYGIRLDDVCGIALAGPLSLLATVLWIVGFVNAFNLIDGMDGVAAGLAVMTSLCMAAVLALRHAPLDTVVVLSLGAACLGFLRYNFHPAKVFMGDAGSTFLGFMFAVVGIVSAMETATFSAVLIPMLAAGVPLFDVFLAVWRRLSGRLLARLHGVEAGCGVMDGDSEHLHHRLLQQHHDQRKTVTVIYAIAAMFAGMAILLQLMAHRAQGLSLVLLALVSISVVRRLAHVELWNSTMLVTRGLQRPRRGVLLAIVHPFYDLVVLIALFLITALLFSTDDLAFILKRHYLELLYAISPVVILLHLGGVYRRHWIAACARDYLYLVELMLVGNLVAAVIRYQFLAPVAPRSFAAFHVFFFLVSLSLILAERMLLRYFGSSTLRRDLYLHRFGVAADLPRALVYGCGQDCAFYLDRYHRDIETAPSRVVGLVDDNPVLHGQHLYGYEVFGGGDALAELHRQHRFTKLVLTCVIADPERERRIRAFCQTHGIAVSRAGFQETVPEQNSGRITAPSTMRAVQIPPGSGRQDAASRQDVITPPVKVGRPA